ncbi:MAG: hypothetical protein CMI53_00600 [Parcubacteria group bacterium]|nr:hypothetical protein [Parcubacteria group bacterium]|tara:strand:+ start:18092 stop:18376 length:285 start_codon:yes stop_codon:yes gene_type:complete
MDDSGEISNDIVNLLLAWITPLIGVAGIIFVWVSYTQGWVPDVSFEQTMVPAIILQVFVQLLVVNNALFLDYTGSRSREATVEDQRKTECLFCD